MDVGKAGSQFVRSRKRRATLTTAVQRHLRRRLGPTWGHDLPVRQDRTRASARPPI